MIFIILCLFCVAIEFEKHLQRLESENRLYEMGLEMKRASLETNKDLVCSLEALRSVQSEFCSG